MVYLIIAVGDQKKKLALTTEFLFIGQDPDNQIRLSDPKVSKKHCQILKTEGGYRILDLGSENGTLVNGEKVTQQDLKEGDIIQIGNVKMTVKDLAPPAQAPASTAVRGPAKKVIDHRAPAAGARRRKSCGTLSIASHRE